MKLNCLYLCFLKVRQFKINYVKLLLTLILFKFMDDFLFLYIVQLNSFKRLPFSLQQAHSIILHTIFISPVDLSAFDLTPPSCLLWLYIFVFHGASLTVGSVAACSSRLQDIMHDKNF